MTSIPRYGDTDPSQRKTQGSRRSLNAIEEQTLIYCLKELISAGWKSDNGFRPGYLNSLLKAMNARLPHSNIELKHINSKLTMWKKTYYQVLGMQGTSGFGWNESGKTITVDDDIWALYVQAHPDVANMRYKTYPYYDDWVEIFGKDRATGDLAEDFVEIVEDLVRCRPTKASTGKGKEPMMETTGDDFSMYSSPCVDLTTDASDCGDFIPEIPPYNMGFENVTPKVSKLSKKIKKEKVKKEKIERKRKTLTPESNEGSMDKFIDTAKSVWGDLSHRFAKEEDTYDEKAQKIIDALDRIDSLTDQNRIFLSFKIMDNAKHVSLFLKSNEKNREHIAHMMLNNQMP